MLTISIKRGQTNSPSTKPALQVMGIPSQYISFADLTEAKRWALVIFDSQVGSLIPVKSPGW